MLTLDEIRNTVNSIAEDVVTLYLNVDPSELVNQNQPPGWRIYAKNSLNEIETAQNESDDWKATRAKVDDYLVDYAPQGGKSLVIFAGADTLHTYELPVRLENSWAYGKPLVLPLVWALDEYERYLVVLVDSEHARFLTAFLGNTRTRDEMTIDFYDYDFGEQNYVNNSRSANGQPMSQGANRESFEDMRDAHIRRFHKEIAETIRERMKKIGAERVVLGGNDRAAHQVHELLHEEAKSRVVGILPIPITTDDHQMNDSILEAATNYERETEMDLVNSIIELAKGGGRGALGYDDVQNALTMQQVELLVLPYPLDNEEQATEFMLKVMELNADIELVHGAAAIRLQEEGGIAARLYYVITEAQ
jgi:hypothetical protein